MSRLYRTPTLEKLFSELKNSESWFVFGFELGVPLSQLKKIESHHGKDPDRCKLEILQYWLNNNLHPTWNEIARALEKTDQLALAAKIKHDYLLPEDKGVSTHVPASELIAPANPQCSAPPVFTQPSTLVTDKSTSNCTIEADVAVVSNLKELESAFGSMLVQVKRRLDKCDISEALLFLGSVIGSKEFLKCDTFGKLMWQLLQDHHIDVFNIYNLQRLVANFDEEHGELTKLVDAYNEKKEQFLKQTTVLAFQRAVVSRVEPILASGMAAVTIRILEGMASDSTLKDMEKLAMEGFEEYHKKFVHLHAEPGSIIISWIFPKELNSRLEQLAYDNVAIFKDSGVIEVTIGGKKVFPYSQHEDMTRSQGINEKEKEKSKLKQLYTEFYLQLVEAVSDPDICRSLTTQFHSTSLLSEEKKAELIASPASGSSYLKVLGVEDEPHLLAVLMEKMSAVKELQTLSEDMSDWLSAYEDIVCIGEVNTHDQFTEKEAHQKIEKLVLDNEKLTSDKADLIARLQSYEEDLKEANELLKMRERAVSGMMAAVHRKDSGVEERDERIGHLEKELDKLRREDMEKIKHFDVHGNTGLILVNNPPRMLPGRPVKLVLTAATTHSANSVSYWLTPPQQDGYATKCPVTEMGDGTYTVTINPTNEGDHQLKVMVESCSTGLHVESWSSKQLEVFTKGLLKPQGIAVTNDGRHVIVTENKKVTVISSSTGEQLASGGNDVLISPWGVTIVNNSILVADKQGPLRYFDFSCSCLSTSKFECTYWIAQHPNGKIYATTPNEQKRVVEFTSDMTSCKPPAGMDLSVFERACGIAIDSKGYLYITDSKRNKVFKFEQTGKRLEFKYQQFDWITGICIDTNDIVYIAEKDKRKILLFDTRGNKLGQIFCMDNPNFCPHGLAVDKKGNVYVCDNNSDKVYVVRS